MFQSQHAPLDVEGVLRRTMEWILRKLGPLNAAIYLPAGESQFSLGAYLNLDTQADGPLIEAIGRTVVSQARGVLAKYEKRASRATGGRVNLGLVDEPDER